MGTFTIDPRVHHSRLDAAFFRSTDLMRITPGANNILQEGFQQITEEYWIMQARDATVFR
jgi:hypothetical protein